MVSQDERSTHTVRELEVFPGRTLYLESRDAGEAVERANAHIELVLSIVGASEGDREATRLAVGEVVANAVKHGNRCDPKKFVIFAAEVYDGVLTISVSDEGVGWNGTALDPCASENKFRPSGRGLFLIRNLWGWMSSRSRRRRRARP